MTDPLVSVCMPAYNASRFIDAAIASLLAQTFPQFELLIIDDGSSDNTLEIAKRHAAADSRVRVLQNDRNRGLVFTRNRLLNEASGDLIASADADDIFAPTRLQQQVEFLQSHADIGVVGGNVNFRVDSGSAVRESSDLYHTDAHIRFFLMLGPCIWNTVTMYRKDLLIKVGGYRDGFDDGAEDYDLWCRLAKRTKLANLKDILACVHVHEGSVTSNEGATKSNIYDVAKPMLSEYLGRDVDRNDARDLVLLFWNGLGTRPEIANVLELSRLLNETAKQREHADTYQLLARRMHESLWKQSQAEIYANRTQSVEAMKLALSLCPTAIGNPSLVMYLLRLLTPGWIRNFVKSRPETA